MTNLSEIAATQAGHTGRLIRIEDRLHRIESTQAEHSDKLTEHDARFDSVDAQLHSVDAQLRSLTQMVGVVLSRLPESDLPGD